MYYMPNKKSTKDALRTHGLTKEVLKEKGAVNFDDDSAPKLIEYLNKYENLPVVAFNAKYDRDQVLKPWYTRYHCCYDKVKKSRWRCAQKRMDRTGRNWGYRLDDALEWFGFERRKDGAKHDALEDARLAAKVYMEASKLPADRHWEHGFVNEEEV